MPLNALVLREVGELARAVNSINDLKYEVLGLQKSQYIFLTRICEHEGISLKALSILLKVDKTTTTKAIQRLIKDGYAEKRKDPEDARGVKLYPTPKSRDVYDVIIAEENRAIEICFEGFEASEIKCVEALLRRMNQNLEAEWFQAKNYRNEL